MNDEPVKDEYESDTTNVETDSEWVQLQTRTRNLIAGIDSAMRTRRAESALRSQRNIIMAAQLKTGQSVNCRISSRSLRGAGIFSGDITTYIPVTRDDQLRIGSIVFCQVQPRNLYLPRGVIDPPLNLITPQ